jgi:lysine 2,3-aminomutase
MRTLRTADALVSAGLVAPERRAAVAAVAARYAVALTPAVVDLIDPTDPADPIARQYVPDPDELELGAGARPDPIGDRAHAPVKGVVHRYPDRALLMPLLHCPVYCRFCFRREVVGGDKALSEAELEAALDYVRADARIWEVVVTGGDPLLLPAKRLARLVRALDAIPHLGVIRFHSRVPVGDPARVSEAKVAALAAADKAVWLAVHCNHPRELSPAARAACRRLVMAGIPLLGQSVLLKGVNDDPAVMEALMRALVRNRIKPYYLHHLDLAPGTARFRVPIAEGQALMRRLRGRVSGLCQPSYVLDIPGGHGKAPIGPSYLGADGTVEDWRGTRHCYPPAD